MKLETVLKPMFPKATELLFHTGNTLTSFKLMKKTNTTITEEVCTQIIMLRRFISVLFRYRSSNI